MPIKFRCQHCQQLLGISRSRAGAIVDCPGCGRSLRVPGLDGETQKLPDPSTTVRRDTSLLSALSELSELNLDRTLDGATGRQTGSAGAPAVVSLAPVTSAEPIEVDIASSPVAPMSNMEQSKPYPIEESLHELTTLQEDSGHVSPAPNSDAEPQSVKKSFAAGLIGAGAALMLLGGFVAGRMTAESGGSPDAVAASPHEPPATENAADAVPDKPVSSGTSILRGRVTFKDQSGESLPDDGALLLVLPSKRTGQVLWNARSLKRPPDHPDRRAVIEALRSLGADVAVADADGRFQGLLLTEEQTMVVAVSRHRPRPDDIDVEESVQNLLSEWFDSVNHICGRLAVRLVPVPDDSEDLQIEFSAEG